MKIVNCEQRSPEWYQARKKKMTASHAQAIGSKGKGLVSYINQIMVEYYSKAQPEGYTNGHMERGRELEDSAAFLYQMEIGVKTEKIGFVVHNDYVGCSPDLLVIDEKEGEGLAEIKCPDDKEFFRLLMGGSVDSKYVWQIQMQMLVCQRKFCDFVAYNPNFTHALHCVRYYWDYGKIAALEAGFKEGERLIKEIEQKMVGLEWRSI